MQPYKTRRERIPGFKSKAELGDQKSFAQRTVFVATKGKGEFVKPNTDL